MKLHNKLLKQMESNRGKDGNPLSHLECLQKVKDKMKREVIQEIDRRKDGRVLSLKDLYKKRVEERNQAKRIMILTPSLGNTIQIMEINPIT